MTSSQTVVKPLDSARPKRRPESLGKIKKAARKLFVERGYHATRPQDIAREAGLGHGTFYLHYDDKRACFLAFVEEARVELQEYVDARVAATDGSLEHTIAASLNAVYDYSESHPGVLTAAMTDEAVIDAEGVQATPLLVRWGHDWALHLQRSMDDGAAAPIYDADIIGQAILGAIHQVGAAGYRSRRKRQDLVDNLTRFLVRALKP